MRDLLRADGSRLGAIVANSIHTEWRNPSAHEEHHWDPQAKRIVIGDTRIRPADVKAAAAYGLSVMHGFETGVACARLRIDDLARRLEEEDAVHEPPLVDARVRSAFARQGLWVWDTAWKGDEVEVVLEHDLDREVHRVLAGVLAAAFVAPQRTRWLISERGSDHRFDVEPEAVRVSRALLPDDTDAGPIDGNVLLPLLSRIKVNAGERAVHVAREITRLALKHPLSIMQDQVAEILRRDSNELERLTAAVDTAARALLASWELLGTEAGQSPVLDELRASRTALVSWRDGDGHLQSVKRHLDRLLVAYHALPDRALRVGTKGNQQRKGSTQE